MTSRWTLPAAWALLAVALVAARAPGERIKDIVDIKGVRGNPLYGYGLVVGLNATGDNSAASRRAMTNILRRNGLVLTPDELASKNIASVLVTTDLPPFARAGAKIDVTLSAIGNASSLQGGTLLMTPLVGADGEVYAVAQGPLTIGGFAAAGETASVSNNHPTVGRIPSGASVEKEELASFVENGHITLQLRNADFTTAQRIAQAVGGLSPQGAQALDAGAVRLAVPLKLTPKDLVGFVDQVLALEVKVDQPAVVVINERTGTIIVGEKVTISSVAISHGNLSIITQEKEFVSQPLPLSGAGTTEKVHRTDIKAVEQKSALVLMPRVSVSELAKALNAMGLTPRDLITIFEALRQAGALQAELKII